MVLLLVVDALMIGGWWLVVDVRCVLFVVRCALFVVWCWSVACCWLLVASVLVDGCWLLVVGC